MSRKPVNFLDEAEYQAWLNGAYKEVMETSYDELRKRLMREAHDCCPPHEDCRDECDGMCECC